MCSSDLAYVTLGPAAGLPLPELSDIYEDENYTDLALGLRPERCGMGLGKYIRSLGLEHYASAVGERYVIEKMRELDGMVSVKVM